MRGSIGQILIANGVIDANALADALARQSGRHPVASELYALGYVSERELCTALAIQTGWPAIVLDESSIRLDVLEYVSLDWARIFSALVVHEDDRSITVAAARPEDAIVPARELGHARGKHVELRIALDITLARTIRVAFRNWKQGEMFLVGAEAKRQGQYLSIVHPDGADGAEASDESRRAQRALAEEAARDIERDDELPSAELPHASLTLTGDWQVNTTSTTSSSIDRNDVLSIEIVEEHTMVIAQELDRGTEADMNLGRIRALVIDPDPPGRIQMVNELERLGYECQAAAAGPEALILLQSMTFEIVFADIATPELDGLRLCRAIKQSRRLGRSRVVITTSVVDSGQVSDEVLAKVASDGYLEKPLDVRKLHRLLRELTATSEDRSNERIDHETLLADALGRYHAGDIEGAIARIRGSLVADPSSPKLHFMLANMLQRASRWAEAVDEYEAVVELQPAYFPALTRLAYLYFRQGLHARAVETWRRALPVCEDPALRRNIELFMRKLVADMSRGDQL